MTAISGALRPTPPMKPEHTWRPEASDPQGFKLESPGQKAKAAIAGAVDQSSLPKNIQGQVSSAIARGLPYDAWLAIPTDPASAGTETKGMPRRT